MKASFAIRIAFRALWRNKLRSTLTALGIIIGVATVICMVSIGNGAKAQVEAQIASLGQNVIIIFSGSSRSSGGVRSGLGGSGNLTLEDAEAIRREIPEVMNLSPEISTYSQVIAGNQNWNTRILGESHEYFDLRQWPFAEGGGFSEQDIRNATKVAVIGKSVSTQLFGDSSPIGQTIRVRNVPFTIIGLLSAKGSSFMGSDQDDVVVIPYTSAMKRLARDSIRSILVQIGNASQMSTAQAQIKSLLRQRHRISGDKPDDFMIHTQEELAETATQTSKVMTYLLAAIAGVSLVVGGIGIMNIMLVSVTERTREIGIRIAIGAQERDIMLQFLLEAIALSLIGGMIGIGSGLGASMAVSHFAGWPTLVSPGSILMALGFSVAIGVFFGFYPARKASRLEPIDALRYE
jgi:putative ABC transport system permease protein